MVSEMRDSEKVFAFGPHARAGQREFSKAILDRGTVNVPAAFLMLMSSFGVIVSGLQWKELALFGTFLVLVVWQYAAFVVEIKLDENNIYVRNFTRFKPFPWSGIKNIRFTSRDAASLTYMVIRTEKIRMIPFRLYTIAPTWAPEKFAELNALRAAIGERTQEQRKG